MPARRAASVLPPTAKMWRPKRVRRVMKSNAATKPTRISAAIGTPRSLFMTHTATSAAMATAPTRMASSAVLGADSPALTRRWRPRMAAAAYAAIADQGDDPTGGVGQELAGQVAEAAGREVDRARLAEHLELQALPAEQAGQRDDEAGIAELVEM